MTAIDAQGTTLEIDDVTPGTPDTLIENIKTFSGFDGEASEIDITDLSSTAKEFRLGLQDWGSFTIDWNVDLTAAGQDVCRAAAISRAVKTLKLTLPDASTATFSALVKNADRQSGAVDGIVEGGVSFRITGAVTYA